MKSVTKQKTKDILILLLSVLLAAASLTTIRFLHVDSSTDAFIPKQDPVIKINEELEEEFGSLDAIIVGITSNESTILNSSSMHLIENLTTEIENLHQVAKVVSLTNSDHMSRGVDGFEVVSLYEGYDEHSLALLSERIDEWSEVYEGQLISSNHKMAAIIVQPESGSTQVQLDALLDDIKDVLAQFDSSETTFSLIGLPSVKQQINRSLLQDVAILAPIAGLLILFVLLFSFRRLAGIILPLAGLLISASITIGIMALLNITFTMATMLVPVLLLIVGSAYAIHVMSHFYAEIELLGLTVDQQNTYKVIDTVLQRNRVPIIMAGATTAAGFIAQLTSPLGPFRTFGILSAVGVVLSQLSSLYLLPAMLRLTYQNGVTLKKKSTKEKNRSAFLFDLFEKWAINRRLAMIIITAVLLAVTIISVFNLKVGTDMIKFFNKNSPLVKDTTMYNENMGGSGILSLAIDGKDPSSVLDPEFLISLENFSKELSEVEDVGKVQTIVPYLKRMNYLMNVDNPPYRQVEKDDFEFDFFSDGFDMLAFDDFFEDEAVLEVESWDPKTYLEIPSDPAKYALENVDDLKALMSQYLLLYAGNLGLLINEDVEPSATLVTIQLKNSDANYLRDVDNQVRAYWDENLPEGFSYKIGGGEAITLALTDLVTKSQIYSLVGALIIVWILVSFIFRSPTAGLIGLIPVAFALMGIFIFMAALKIRLDVITSLLAALAIGIGVDYAIHFIAAFKRQEQANLGEAGLKLTMNTTGKAILINAASVIIGFSGLLFSRFIPIQQMGILFVVSMLFAALSSLTVLPMILIWTKPKFLKPRLFGGNRSSQ